MENYTYYIKGGISGMVGICLSHPVDTIKTHIQTGKIPNNFNLYKGLKPPLIGVGFEKAIVFGTYNWMMSRTQGNIQLSGATAGLTASLIVSPFERLKILKQNDTIIKARDIINPRFLFKGLGTTMTREVPGFAIYFSVYEYLKPPQISYLQAFVNGGLSGIVAWCFIYPQDRIKTIIQSELRRQSISRILRHIYNQGGLLQFYKGFSWAVARASLLHSGTFATMEYLNSWSS